MLTRRIARCALLFALICGSAHAATLDLGFEASPFGRQPPSPSGLALNSLWLPPTAKLLQMRTPLGGPSFRLDSFVHVASEIELSNMSPRFESIFEHDDLPDLGRIGDGAGGSRFSTDLLDPGL